jgi:hypothetical protein
METLARFFGTPITVFFPQAEPETRTNALLSATADLNEEDLEEVNSICAVQKGATAEEEEVGRGAACTSTHRRHDVLCRVFSLTVASFFIILMERRLNNPVAGRDTCRRHPCRARAVRCPPSTTPVNFSQVQGCLT